MSVDIRSQLQSTLSGSYTLERELGGGGMSRVFVADELRLKRKVVVKVLSPELAQGISAERFEREIQLAASLQQANIVPVLNAGESAGLPFYTMPFVEGESLRARLGRGPISITEAASVLRDVARALAYAHERGVVHRDIKPDNVLLSGGTAVVTDFGIAKAISASRTDSGAGATLTQLGTSIGTPAYISPEQAAGDPEVDHRADIYSFGCMAYELLAGRPPFVARTPQRLLGAHMSEAPQPVSELRSDTPAALAAMVMRCLEKEADSRPQTAVELFPALETTQTSDGGYAAMPSILLGGRGVLKKALAVYALAFIIVAIVAKAAIVGIGLPDWVFPGALLVMGLGLPVILFTAYTQYIARRAVTTSPTFTPGGTPRATTGTLATIAIRASPHVSWRRTTIGGVVAVGAFVAAIGVFMLLRAFGIGPAGSLMAAGKLSQRERVILGDFKGPASDSLLGPTVTEAFRTDLAQSASLSIMPANIVRDVLRRMQKPANTVVDYAVAREIATREGIKAVIDGEVVTLGGTYVLSLRLITAQTGEELATFRETANEAKDIIPAISRLSKQLRSRIGESLRAVQNARTLDKVTTPSLPALQKYVAGNRAVEVEGDWPRAQALLEESITLDTAFAMAYRKLALELNNRGLTLPRQQALLQKAYEHRDRLSDAERYLLLGAYFSNAGPHPDRAKVISAYESLLDVDPDNYTALNNVALEYLGRRDFARAQQALTRALRVQTTVAVVYNNLVSAQIGLGKLAEAQQTAELAAQNLPRNPLTAVLFERLAASRQDYERYLAISDSVRAARPNDASTNLGELNRSSAIQLLRGRIADGTRLRAAARGMAFSAGNVQARLQGALDAAEINAWFREDKAAALRDIERALAAYPLDSMPAAIRPYDRLAFLYSISGRPDRARTVVAQFERDPRAGYPEDVQGVIHGALGEIALAERRYDDAVREFRASDVGPCTVCALPNIARAYDLAGNADSAIAVFSRYTDGLARNAIDALQLAGSHKRLGELYEAKGDRQRAASHYTKFVELWKSADPDMQPRVAEVRKRLARLSDVEGKR
jgi:tetratricopeptide (TPR) repeat protein/tRNA A-37 threonylcarbamoyl transferase component Bud32